MTPSALPRAATEFTIEDVIALTAPTMAEVDALIARQLDSDIALINQVAAYLIQGGGKRIRPQIHLLSALACGSEGDPRAVKVAAIIEFIHTATLLHDDVVDESDQRRGQQTANAIWGNAASVLVGDFLYSRAFQLMVDVNEMRVMDILADTTNRIAEGEVAQLLNIGDAETSRERYYAVIEAKTAKLFASAAQLGGLLAGASEATQTALQHYGQQLGIAFQLADDLLDLDADADALGKCLGDDLAEGKPTLPIIEALAMARGDDQRVLRDAITNGRREAITDVVAILHQTGAMQVATQAAEQAAQSAIDAIAEMEPSTARTALETLAYYAIGRTC